MGCAAAALSVLPSLPVARAAVPLVPVLREVPGASSVPVSVPVEGMVRDGQGCATAPSSSTWADGVAAVSVFPCSEAAMSVCVTGSVVSESSGPEPGWVSEKVRPAATSL